MFTFHYLICNNPVKETATGNNQYNVKKLIFDNDKLSSSDDLLIVKDKLDILKNELILNQYTNINDCKIDLESFLKNINLSKIN
jgi:hypothetical protein